jgi:dihydroflavonol-4-reductase
VVKDPQRDLVDPAVEGTKNVLGAADRTDSVERVVLTSSCAAIYGDNRDIAKAPGKTLTEDIWNTSSSLDHQAYSYSKTQAEAAAWEVAGAQGRWKLVAVNPALVLGPGVKPQATSESFTLIKQLGNGTMKTGAPPLEFGVVDVRDVAEAHLRAAFIPAAEGRHITCAETMSLLDMAAALRAEFGDDWALQKSELPKWLVWLTGPMINKALTRKFISRNLGWPFRADNAKSREALGMEYRPAPQAVVDMFAQMVEAGLVKKR